MAACFISLPAQETAKSIPSKMVDATVFLSGAELTLSTVIPSSGKEGVGIVTWKEDFNPGETKEYKFSYSIQYPKGRIVE